MADETKVVKTKKAEKKAKAPKAPKAPKVKKPGVIATIKRMCLRGNGASLKEVMEELRSLFPDKDAAGMEATCKIQFSRIPREDNKITVEKKESETRGLVFTFTEKK